jgi:hypothetical protein
MARRLGRGREASVRPRVRTHKRRGRAGLSRPGTVVFVVVASLFVAVSLPVVLRGAPLADDFTNCVQPQREGLGSTLGDSIERLGAARKAHLLEILITTETCQHLPFGFAIAVSLAVTLAVALLLRGLLRDLGTPDPWPEVGGALWLLHPVGAETALWPAALHVPLGLAFALAALRLHRSGRYALGALAVAGACLSVEQVVLALPLAVWITTPRDRRPQAMAWTVSVIVVLLVAFVALPGDDPRLHVALSERLAGPVDDPGFLVLFPAVGLGLQSIPLAIAWAFPVSVAVLVAGAFLGLRSAPVLFAEGPDRTDRRAVIRTLLAGLGLVAAVNLPIVFNIPHQGSPRLFVPTWLVISAVVGRVASLLHVRKPRPLSVAAGVFASAALLSLALSVWTRVESASFTESASEQIAAEIPEGAVVGVCGITRAVVQPAPRGAFAIHEFVYDWAARDALFFYTGRRAEFLLAGEPWDDRRCPREGEVDRVVSFPALVMRWRGDG